MLAGAQDDKYVIADYAIFFHIIATYADAYIVAVMA